MVVNFRKVSTREARSFFALAVVISHVALVSYCAIYFQSRVTKFETYVSIMAAFLPVFGTYVAIVVKNIGPSLGPKGRRVSTLFISLMTVLLVAYIAGILFVIRSYGTGFIGSEDMLPAAIALVEAAFGGFFTSLFLTLFGVSDES